MKFGSFLRDKGFKGKLILCTFAEVPIPPGFNSKIEKDKESIEAILL